MAAVEGSVEKGFEPVKELLARNFASQIEYNAQLCVFHKGKKIIDIWGSGIGDNTYGPDTLQTVFSSTKSVTAIVIAVGVDRGFLDYNQKVTTYWPEFGTNGKGDVTLADVLRHEAGLPGFTQRFEWEDILPEQIKKNAVGKVIE